MSDFQKQLRNETAGVRLHVKVFGVRRALDDSQVSRAAQEFHADSDFVSARKRILNTRSKAYRDVLAAIGKARAYWRSMTVDYPIDGIRLIRKELVPIFNSGMEEFAAELAAALKVLGEHYGEMRAEAKSRLGELFNDADYPADLTEFFALQWEFPSIEPPDYLKQLNPKLYEQEQARVAARLDEAVKAAEQAFTVELKAMVDHLLDRLSGTNADGKPKVFRDSAVENLSEFFDRFSKLKVSNNAELNAVVELAENMLGGVDPSELRKDAGLKTSIAKSLTDVQAKLDTLIVNKPTRAIDLSDDEEAGEVGGGEEIDAVADAVVDALAEEGIEAEVVAAA